MDKIQIFQQFLEDVGEKTYKGTYLFKYIIYEVTSGIIENYQQKDRNDTFLKMLSDDIPKASEGKIEKTQQLIGELTERDVLFHLTSLRRYYQGQLEHTAGDAYIQTLEERNYIVLENDPGNYQEGDSFVTKNLNLYSPTGIVGCYGQDEVDKDELVKFFFLNYILPLEEAYNITFPQDIMLVCIKKMSLILKERRAFLTFFKEVLNKVKPKVVCYTHGQETFTCFLREAAQELGIPTVEIGHGAVIRNLIYPDTLAYADYYLTYSDVLTKPMRERRLKNIYTVGKPNMYSGIGTNVSRENKPIVISFISSLEPGLFIKAKELAKKLDTRTFIVAYKIHPLEHWDQAEMDEITREIRNLIFIPGGIDVRELYEKTDIIVGIRSSGILDALPYCKKKILVMQDDKEEMLLTGNVSEIFDFLDETGDLKKIASMDELLEEIYSYQRGMSYRGAINHYWPRDSIERFRDFIQIFIDGKIPSEEEFYVR